MRISDWSSDVCSSDLGQRPAHLGLWRGAQHPARGDRQGRDISRRGRAAIWLFRDRARGQFRAQARFPAGVGRGGGGGAEAGRPVQERADRKSVGEGKSVYVRVDLGGRRIIKKKKKKK